MPPWKEIKREQRAQDRSRRATNPDNYHAEGTLKRGSRKWQKDQSATRSGKDASQHVRENSPPPGRSNTARGAIKSWPPARSSRPGSFHIKPFRRTCGRSAAVRAPGMFLELLTGKAENAGGSVENQNTRSSKQSQTCLCGKVEKKPLKQRRQVCSFGPKAQGDLFSAPLARQCTNQSLDICQAKTAWPAGVPLLRRAMSRLSQTAESGGYPRELRT
jgi:putative transposase